MASDIGTSKSDDGVTFVNGRWHYTEPSSGETLIFDDHTQQWIPSTSHSEKSANSKDEQNFKLIDGIWHYVDPVTNLSYVYNSESQCWTGVNLKSKKEIPTTSESDMDEFEYQLREEERERAKQIAGPSNANETTTVRFDASDNTAYEWDATKQAWFPKAESEQKDPFLPTDPKQRKEYLKQKKKEHRRLISERQKNRGWFDMDEEHNLSVYVSGLPLDLSMAEFQVRIQILNSPKCNCFCLVLFQDLMSKCGLIARDPISNKLKLKLYKSEEGDNKGDGLCTYIKKESLELAKQILDGYQIRNHVISIEKARFEMKGSYDPSKKRKSLTAKQKKLLKEKQDKLFDWRPERLRGERPKSDCTVIIKYLFTSEEISNNAAILLDRKELLKTECGKYGTVKKIVLYDNNPEGVAAVTFAEPTEADDCITMMDWRIFEGNQLRADRWDGVTKYKVEETEDEEKKRLSQWENYLTSVDAPGTSSS
ncbi:HIV Tat-specific factor 1 -like protein [Trichinella nativa]|uniref:HIV Tat-specific factor 1-like protein n=1 Tax=Trichinella nativa TaxID=6335 RepID=A0A0V1KPW2_9BILA|nr:HIV Tat-specific factor 1 -like protein [Trichinella nativa]